MAECEFGLARLASVGQVLTRTDTWLSELVLTLNEGG